MIKTEKPIKRKTNIPQLLKWIGNKHKFALEITTYMPQKFNTYYEPFLGSGAVLGTVSDLNQHTLCGPNFERAIAGDSLKYVVDIFNYVKNEPNTIINHYANCIKGYNDDKKANYEAIKARFNTTKSSLDFAVLTRTCYSGIVRFRKADGYMSTPVGPHNPIPPESFAERVMIWNSLIQNTTFIHADFSETMALAGDGDVIYCDPPYTHSQSILYGAQAFRIEQLWESIYAAKQRGAKVMLSINGTRESGDKDIGVVPPEGLFERATLINCGVSMIDRLQNAGDVMASDVVHDKLLLTW
jgi:DNA adenine methylase